MSSDAAPSLPALDGSAVLRVAETPDGPARDLTIHIRYPAGASGRPGRIENVNAGTGLMLDLHNWGGTAFVGAPDPDTLASAYNLVVIGVDYLQSGPWTVSADSAPYDFGCVQALDALRALYFVRQSLRDTGRAFDATRIYGAGGSGGGNVIQMANKFAPHTFACIVDLSGMASLTDDIAYGLPGGSTLNAGYSRDPASPAYLSPAMQELRDLGNPAHLARQAQAGSRGRIVVIHGEEDTSCLAADKRRVVAAMQAAGLEVRAHFLSPADVDGKLIVNCGHSLGNRTALLRHFAGACLDPADPALCRLAGPCDFDRRDTVTYPVAGGAYVISYPSGFPALAFTPAAP